MCIFDYVHFCNTLLSEPTENYSLHFPLFSSSSPFPYVGTSLQCLYKSMELYIYIIFLFFRSNQKNVEVSSKKYKCILGSLSLGSSQEMNTSNLLEWLSFLCGHLRLLQESIKRPWQEFSACQEAIKRCQSFLANHYIYRSYPESLIKLVDKETGLCPFQYVNMQS